MSLEEWIMCFGGFSLAVHALFKKNLKAPKVESVFYAAWWSVVLACAGANLSWRLWLFATGQ